MFKIINISLGEIKIGLQQNIYYPYENIERIIKMIAPCDCSVPIHEPNSSRLLVKYVPKNVPKHLKLKGHHQYTTKKIITIQYTTKDEPEIEKTILLSFTAIVKE